MENITEPGTITDLVDDARRAGYGITARLVRDWSEHGLLDYPDRQPAGRGQGSRPALYTANQRKLLLILLEKRTENRIRSLARIPVSFWTYWGEQYVPLRQARRAFMTWLGDPRVSRKRAREYAQDVLGRFDNPRATDHDRRHLLEVVTDLAYTGKLDVDRLDQAMRAVFEPDSVHVHRALGHPAAPITADAMISVTHARLTAMEHLNAGAVTDEAFLQARQAHLITLYDYAQRQQEYAAAAPGTDQYKPVTGEFAITQCCNGLLTVLGFHILYPDRAKAVLAEPVPHITFSVTPEV